MIVIKNTLTKKMCVVRTPEVENSTKIMEVHTVVRESQSSWTETYKRLREDNIKIH